MSTVGEGLALAEAAWLTGRLLKYGHLIPDGRSFSEPEDSVAGAGGYQARVYQSLLGF